jgi:hypothetical protein
MRRLQLAVTTSAVATTKLSAIQTNSLSVEARPQIRSAAAKYVTEAIGTFMLVFTVGVSVPALWVYLVAQLLAAAAAGGVPCSQPRRLVIALFRLRFR